MKLKDYLERTSAVAKSERYKKSFNRGIDWIDTLKLDKISHDVLQDKWLNMARNKKGMLKELMK